MGEVGLMCAAVRVTTFTTGVLLGELLLYRVLVYFFRLRFRWVSGLSLELYGQRLKIYERDVALSMMSGSLSTRLRF